MAAGNNFILFNLEGGEHKLDQYIQSQDKMYKLLLWIEFIV